jgi:hypothetical protein
MTRYYNKITRTEAITGVHSIEPPDVVELPEENVFWQPIPPGKQLVFDADNIPTGYEDIPPPVFTPLEQAVNDLHGQGINSDAMTKAAFLVATKGDDTKLDLIEAAIDAAVVAYGVTYAEIVEAL